MTAGSGLNYSHIFYNVGIQVTAKWQFWSTTQSPVFWPSAIIFWASGPCPWPRDIDEIFFFFWIENEFKLANGSEPGLKINISGLIEDESK